MSNRMSREQVPVTSHQSHVTPNFPENKEVRQKAQNIRKGGWGYELAVAFVYQAIKEEYESESKQRNTHALRQLNTNNEVES